MDVVAAEVARQDGFGGGFAPGEVGAGEVSRAADELRQKRCEQVDGVFGGFAGGNGTAGFVVLGEGAVDNAVNAVRQFAAHGARVFLGFCRVFVLVFLPDVLPLVLQFGAFVAQAGNLVGVGGQFKVAGGQTERLFGQRNFFFAERRAVGFFGAFKVGRAKADFGAADDERGFGGFGFGGGDGGVYGGVVVSVHIADDVPAVGFIAQRGVFAKPRRDFAVNGDAIAVVEADEFAEAEGAGKRAGF